MKHALQTVTYSTLSELKNVLRMNYSSDTVFLISKRAADRYQFTEILEPLVSSSSIVWISEFSVNPTQNDILHGLRTIGDYSFHQVIAIGGGSAIDLAKGILAMYPLYKDNEFNDQQLKDTITKSIINHDYTIPKGISVTAIPTTAGTGSEATSWATIWDYNHQAKYSISDSGLTPTHIYLVPELTLTLPPRITLATGLDALAHAMEAYWAKATNPDAQALAMNAVANIAKTLPKLLQAQDQLPLRTSMLEASYTAGLAFSQTKTTACHSISYPLTYLYGIEHGFAVALTLPQVAEINKKKVSDIELLLQSFESYGGLSDWIHLVTEGIVQLNLSNWNITREDIPAIVKRAYTQGRIDNNPVPLTEEDIKEILVKSL